MGDGGCGVNEAMKSNPNYSPNMPQSVARDFPTLWPRGKVIQSPQSPAHLPTTEKEKGKL